MGCQSTLTIVFICLTALWVSAQSTDHEKSRQDSLIALAKYKMLGCDMNEFKLGRTPIWVIDSINSKTYERICFHTTTYINLDKDSVFQFKMDRDGTGGLAQGTWTMKSDSLIILNSDSITSLSFIARHASYNEWRYRYMAIVDVVMKVENTQLQLEGDLFNRQTILKSKEK